MFDGIYRDRKVLITGHTGFKGSWLGLWLERMGAEVVGYSLAPETKPNHFELLRCGYRSIIADVCDYERLSAVVDEERPDIVFHLAAQSLVRRSYRAPRETFSTNVTGTVNLLEACRRSSGVGAVVVVTSDKCYENNGSGGGYRECDRLGGHDPYSASKGCAELVASSYRRSFFPAEGFGRGHSTLVATARAGNVIGGGDWAEDRLIPDIVRASWRGEKVVIRNPHATRPWQHVLESLSGYLLLGRRLLEGNTEFADAWNFGPAPGERVRVSDILEKLKKDWDGLDYELSSGVEPHEAACLELDSSKARTRLGWAPVWDIDKAVEAVGRWYRSYYERAEVVSVGQLDSYVESACDRNLTEVRI